LSWRGGAGLEQGAAMNDASSMFIQKLRLQRGWSQEQLAELSGLSVRTIQRLEKGTSASPESLKAVASVFEIDFNRLREPAMDDALKPDLREDEAEALAHVRKVKGFYLHLLQYLVVIAALVVLDVFSAPRLYWSVWTGGIWGSMVLAHAWQVFGSLPFGADWERRQVERRLGRSL
jgi:transcriptional regulator with XRE-family HTH domain